MRKIDFLKMYGRTVTLTNMLTNGNFTSKTGWTGAGTVSNNILYATAAYAGDGTYQFVTSVAGHVYYFGEYMYGDSHPNIIAYMYDGTALTQITHNGSQQFIYLSNLFTAKVSTASCYYKCFQDQRSSGFTQEMVKYATVIDLTVAFGAGLEPTKSQMDGLMSQFANNWLNGTQTVAYDW